MTNTPAWMGNERTSRHGRWHLTEVSETGSTNADLLALAANGAPDGTVLRADFQSAGRGRLERTWVAPAGENLLVSILFRRLPTHLHQLTHVVALAAREAIADLTGVSVGLKWPNDLLVDNRKLAGVLAQSGGISSAGGPDHVVVGIGINIGWAPDDAVSLAVIEPDRLTSPREVMLSMLSRLETLCDGSWDDIHQMYRAALDTLGQQVKIDLPTGEHVIGRALDVEVDGRLVVLDECAISHRFDTGDIVHLRPHLRQ